MDSRKAAMSQPQYEVIEGEIMPDPPSPTHPIFVFVICPPAVPGNRVGGEKRRPSERELLREWVSQARPLVLKPIASMEKATMDNKYDDENDTSWATWDLLGPAALIVGALLGLVGLWLWGGW